MDLVTSVAHVYLDAGKITEAQEYLAMAKKANNKDPKVSVLELSLIHIYNPDHQLRSRNNC